MVSTSTAKGGGGRQGRTPQHAAHSDSDSTQFVESELGSEPGSPSSEICGERRQQQKQQQQRQPQQQQQLHQQQQLPLPSQGSAAHGKGVCHPCAWYWKPVGCLKAQDCRYCHLCPDGELKRRRKQKVAMIRMGTLDGVNQFKTIQMRTTEYRMTIKNTFIHMEAQDVPSNTHIDVVETVTAAGLTFSVHRRG